MARKRTRTDKQIVASLHKARTAYEQRQIEKGVVMRSYRATEAEHVQLRAFLDKLRASAKS